MKKFLILIPVVLLALWASITWIIGSQTQSGFAFAIEKINENLGAASGLTSVSEESYSRGFLSSQAVTKITNINETDPDKQNAYLNIKAWHGPLMMTPNGLKIGAEYVLVTLDKSRLPEKIQKELDEGFKGAEPVKLGIFTGFGGGMAFDANVSPFSSDDDEHTIKFEGFSADFQTDINTSFAKGKFNIGAFSANDKNKTGLISAAAASGELDYTDIKGRVSGNGSSYLDFPEFKITSDGNTFAVKGLHLDNVATQSDGKLNSTSKISIGGFKGPDKGPNAEIFSMMNGKLELEMIAEGMDIEALQVMAAAQQKMQIAQAGKEENGETTEQALHDYMIAASQLLKPDLKMKYHAAFTNKSGESKIGLGLEYTSTKPLFELGTILDLLGAVEIALDMQIAKDLIPAASAQQIEPAVAMGFVQDKGAFYKGGAILAGGELTVNGKVSPVLKQMGPMLNMPIPWENMGIKKNK